MAEMGSLRKLPGVGVQRGADTFSKSAVKDIPQYRNTSDVTKYVHIA